MVCEIEPTKWKSNAALMYPSASSFLSCNKRRACRWMITSMKNSSAVDVSLSRVTCDGILFFRRTTPGMSFESPAGDGILGGALPAVDCGNEDDGVLSSPIFGFIVVEKLRPRAIEPKIRLKSSAFGLTGAFCCDKCNLFPMTNEVRGDSTSLGSEIETNWMICFCLWLKRNCCPLRLPIALKNRTKSLAKSHFCCSNAVSNRIVAYCRLTDDGSRFCKIIK